MPLHQPQEEAEYLESEAREPTAMLEIDGGLRLRLGIDLLVELSVLRLRIAAAFAAKVRHSTCKIALKAEFWAANQRVLQSIAPMQAAVTASQRNHQLCSALWLAIQRDK